MPRPALSADDAHALDRAARALGRGDPLAALAAAGTGGDARARLVCGIAYAQLGDHELARAALGEAGRTGDARTRARAGAALAELAFADGTDAVAAATAAAAALRRTGDHANATMLELVLARAEVEQGQLSAAAARIAAAAPRAALGLPRGVAALVRAEIAIRAVAPDLAAAALAEVRGAGHRVLERAAAALAGELHAPLARIERAGATAPADLFAIAALAREDVVVVDRCRQRLARRDRSVDLAGRPVLFALAAALAASGPLGASRDALAREVFGARRPNDSHRARLRVELGRLRALLRPVGAAPVATPTGYRLDAERPVVILAPVVDTARGRVALLLHDGARWSAAMLAERAGVSPRTVQRALAELVAEGVVVATGRGKQRRYVRPGPPIASRMLLLALVATT